MRGLVTLLLGLIFLPLAAVGLPGLLLSRSAQDGHYVAEVLEESGLFTAALDGLERLAQHSEQLEQYPEPLRRALFAAVRQAVPPALCLAEASLLHAAVLDWLDHPDKTLDFSLDLKQVREDASTILAREASDELAAIPSCRPEDDPDEATCVPAAFTPAQRAADLVGIVFQSFPDTLDLREELDHEEQTMRAALATSLMITRDLAALAAILLLGIPLLVLLLNLNHRGRMLRRTALVVLIPAVLAVLLVHLAMVAAEQEVDSQARELLTLQGEVLAVSEAQIAEVGRRLVDRVFGDLLVWPYLIVGGALVLLVISFFFGGPRPAVTNGGPPPAAAAATKGPTAG